MAKDGPFSIPSIKGRIAEKLDRASARIEQGDDELEFPPEPAEVTLRSPDERGVVALACLILENLREHGGTRAPKRSLENVLRRTLASFGPKEVMDIEVEAYEILLWLAKSIDPEWSSEATSQVEEVDEDSSYDDLIRWAIGGNEDLEMDYYSRGRGELTHRRVTPISLEAETYLHAYCHLRRDERVFRLSRIADLHPVGGWREDQLTDTPSDEGDAVEEAEKGESGGAEEQEEDEAQMSLLE